MPRATSINYDEASAGSVEFEVLGIDFQRDIGVSFWDGAAEIEGTIGSVEPPEEGGTEFTLRGKVDLPKAGIYQLILQNPNVPKHVQPCWIYVAA